MYRISPGLELQSRGTFTRRSRLLRFRIVCTHPLRDSSTSYSRAKSVRMRTSCLHRAQPLDSTILVKWPGARLGGPSLPTLQGQLGSDIASTCISHGNRRGHPAPPNSTMTPISASCCPGACVGGLDPDVAHLKYGGYTPGCIPYCCGARQTRAGHL